MSTNPAAELAKLRWAGTTPEERSEAQRVRAAGRMTALTPARRAAIAKKASKAAAKARTAKAMKTGTFRKLGGEVETDETFIGGKARNMHKAVREKKIKGRGSVGKSIIHGMIERGGEARCSVVKDTEAGTVQVAVRRNVEKGAIVFSDEMPSYSGLDAGYIHEVINHAKEYVRGRVHTNTMENFWSLLKRALGGTYVSVAPFHLTRYLDEQTFRFNKRKGSDGSRFYEVLLNVVGKRLTWRVLTAQEDAGFMGIR